VETKSLDGETNLKLKNVATDLIKFYNKDESITDSAKQVVLKYEAPNPYLNRFYGRAWGL
jgi:phospholipid-transporting ATPase